MGPRPSRLHLALAAALAMLTIAAFAPVVGFEFLNYDDPSYVVAEAHVNTGLSAANVRWSFTTFANANWHPVTNLSHQLDVALFGVDPAAHHGMNLAIHVVNVLLLFWLLARATAAAWPAAFVAAAFAVHPLNIQTVAWISERKSLLSTAFWLLALIAHVEHRRTRSWTRYVLVVAAAALAVSAKPMAVTLPLTLVLFDLWPLAAAPVGRGSLLARYARELAPVVALSLACGLLTLAAQGEGKAIQTLAAIPWLDRIGNAFVAYAWYLKAMVWPSGLAVFYPHTVGAISAIQVAVSATVLVAISALAVVKRRELPWLAMGWCWYIGTMLPVSGLIQVGWQAYADRYAYVPLIGIFVAIGWSVARLTHASALGQKIAIGAGAASILAMTISTRAQLPYWHDTIALFQRAIDVVPGNALAHNNLGMALVAQNKMGEALGHFEKAVGSAPWDAEARANLGNALRALGRPEEAAAAYAQAIEIAPGVASTYFNLATALVDLGRVDEAVARLQDAVRLDPTHIKARLLLATILYRQGRVDETLTQLREVARLDPGDARVGEWVRRIEAQRSP